MMSASVDLVTHDRLPWPTRLRQVPAPYVVIAGIVAVAVLASGRSTSPLPIMGVDPIVEVWGPPWDQAHVFAQALRIPVLAAGALAAPLATIRPWLGLVLAAAGFVPVTVVPPAISPSTYIALVGVSLTAAWAARRTSWWAAALATSLLLLNYWTPMWLQTPVFVLESAGWDLTHRAISTVAAVLAGLVVVAGGSFLRRWTERTATAQELAARERDVANAVAAVDERARLARDLHDVVAHRISLIAVRAETAPFAYPELKPEARRLLADTAVDARKALDEMRTVLGVLHRSVEQPRRTPQPGPDDVAALLAEARSAGSVIRVTGDWPPLDAGREHAAFRILQEALTNARRHGTGGAIAVTYAHTDDDVILRVDNAAAPAVGGVVIGRGLTGMRERVELLGGALTISNAVGRFLVQARLPRGER